MNLNIVKYLGRTIKEGLDGRWRLTSVPVVSIRGATGSRLLLFTTNAEYYGYLIRLKISTQRDKNMTINVIIHHSLNFNSLGNKETLKL